MISEDKFQIKVEAFKLKGHSFDIDNFFRVKAPHGYRDITTLTLCLKKVGSYLMAGFHVELPTWIKTVTFKYCIDVITIDGTNSFNIINGTRSAMSYDNGLYGNGPGPFAMVGEFNNSTGGHQDWAKLFSNYVRPDGLIIFSYKITAYKIQYESESIMIAMYRKLYPNGEDSEIEKLESELAINEEELTKNKTQKDALEIELKNFNDVLNNQKIKAQTYLSDNEKLMKDNLNIQKELTDMKNRNTLLEGQLKTCKADTAFQNLNPEKIRLDGYDTNAKRGLLLRLMEIQSKISQEIINEEICGLCKKAEKKCAVQPCGHMAFCKNCYDEQIQQSEPELTNKVKDISEKAKSEEKTKKRELKCPVCQVIVEKGIIVKT